MTADRDDVALSDWERRAFAAIQEELALEEPTLARGFPRRFRSGLAVPVVLIVVGAIGAVATFTRSLWFGVAGLAVMTIGVVLAAGPVAVRAIGRGAAPRDRAFP